MTTEPTTIHSDHYEIEFLDPPPPNPDDKRPKSQKNHYWCKATCRCGWESRDCQYWGQAVRAWNRHLWQRPVADGDVTRTG